MTGGGARGGTGILVRVAAGTLLLQSAFDAERRQALGVAAALAPAARFWPAGEPRRAFLRRHLENFNTNPAFAGPILGAVVRLEEQAAGGDAEAARRVPRVKRGLEGPFAAAGDAVLWGGARPAAAHWGSAAALAAGAAGPALFLVLYNVVHLGFRVGGVFWGYRRGGDVHRLLRTPLVRHLAGVFPWAVLAGAVVLGAAAFGEPDVPLGPSFAGAAAAVVGFALGRRGFTRGTLLAAGAMMFGLIASFLFTNGSHP